MSGDHSPGVSYGSWDDLGITCDRFGIGKYRISGKNIEWPDGWRATVFRDENDLNTIWVKLYENDGFLIVESFDPVDTSKCIDIIHLLTLRVACEPAI